MLIRGSGDGRPQILARLQAWMCGLADQVRLKICSLYQEEGYNAQVRWVA
jgi:hypothetical protein